MLSHVQTEERDQVHNKRLMLYTYQTNKRKHLKRQFVFVSSKNDFQVLNNPLFS